MAKKSLDILAVMDEVPTMLVDNVLILTRLADIVPIPVIELDVFLIFLIIGIMLEDPATTLLNLYAQLA